MEHEDGAATEPLLGLDELCARTGLSVRTVRFYTSRGLVPPPIRRGRSGYYSGEHVARLELVQDLQAHGFTLAAIERYLAALPADAGPGDIALRRTMLTPWQEDPWVPMSRAELERRADRTLSDDDLEALRALDLVRTAEAGDAGRVEVAVARLSIGLALLDLGFPPEAARAASAIYAEHGRRIATELYEVFRGQVWPVYRDAGASPETVQAVVEQLKPLSVASLVAAYEAGMDQTRREQIERGARRRSDPA